MGAETHLSQTAMYLSSVVEGARTFCKMDLLVLSERIVSRGMSRQRRPGGKGIDTFFTLVRSVKLPPL